jgi:hypothetical protein
MNKLERDGMVAVLVSPGFGAGWASAAWSADWGAAGLGCKDHEGMCMDADIVQAVLDGDKQKAADIARMKYGDVYTGGADDLVVEWLPKGTKFVIDEYDGSETIREFDDTQWLIA